MGPIPQDHRVRHRCGNLACCNPAHLYLTSLEQRLQLKIEKQANGCWIWQGYINRKGYGRIGLSGHRRNVHRLAYELWVEQIPEGCAGTRYAAIQIISSPGQLRKTRPYVHSIVSKGEGTISGRSFGWRRQPTPQRSARSEETLYGLTLARPSVAHSLNS